MRIRLLVAVLSLSALSAAAQMPRSEDLFTPRAFASHIIIPAAGDVPGASGTHFRTDLHIINLRNVDQTVALYWLPQGRSGLSTAPKSVRLNARSGIFSSDFVASVLGQTGLGSVEIIAVDAAGEEDLSAQLHAVARIWTPEPNVPNGTMSQSFPALAISSASRGNAKWIFGVRRENQYRLNVGVVNTARERQRFRVTLIPNTAGAQSEVVDLEVNARSMDQVRIDGARTGTFQVTVVNLSDAENTSDWQAWSSSIDNITGDAWSQVAFPTP